jgi:hypothetical protein
MHNHRTKEPSPLIMEPVGNLSTPISQEPLNRFRSPSQKLCALSSPTNWLIVCQIWFIGLADIR